MMRIVSPPPIRAADVANEEHLRAVFDVPSPPNLGLEEEIMLLDPATLDLVPRSVELLEAMAPDARFALELPASQLELIVGPVGTVREAIAGLAAARAELAGRTNGELRL